MSKDTPPSAFVPINVAVITVSDTRTLQTDVSGQTATQLLEAGGHKVVERELVMDEKRAIQDTLGRVLGRSAADIVVMTGGSRSGPVRTDHRLPPAGIAVGGADRDREDHPAPAGQPHEALQLRRALAAHPRREALTRTR